MGADFLPNRGQSNLRKRCWICHGDRSRDFFTLHVTVSLDTPVGVISGVRPICSDCASRKKDAPVKVSKVWLQRRTEKRKQKKQNRNLYQV